MLQVFRPSAQVPDVVREALERRRERGDIEVIWLQDGIYNEEARKLAEQAGITVIQDRCMRQEYKRLMPQLNQTAAELTKTIFNNINYKEESVMAFQNQETTSPGWGRLTGN